MGKIAELKKRYPYITQQVGLYGTILAVLICAYIFVQYFNNSQSVVLVNPPQEITDILNIRVGASSQYPPQPLGIPQMSDPRWKDVKIGDTERTIGENGSLLCALAFLTPPNSHMELTPDKINARLMDAGAYAANDNLDWEKAGASMPWLSFSAHTGFSPEAAYQSMQMGSHVLAKVRLRDNVAHWVSIYYASPEGYLVADPLTGEPAWLSDYGRVYTLVTAAQAE